VRFGDTSKVEIQGASSIVFEGKPSEHPILHGIYYIPALRNSIMSLGQLDEGRCKVEIERGYFGFGIGVGDFSSRSVAAQAITTSFTLRQLGHSGSPRVRTMKLGWHEQFGHLHFEALHKLSKAAMVHRMPVINHVKQLCDTCITTK
jgi:hypothetical protein